MALVTSAVDLADFFCRALPGSFWEASQAIGFITPADMLAGRQQAIWDERDRKLEAAREQRRLT